MALKFLNKKGWHTGSLRNIENVWKAEQKHEAEQKKLEELRKQIHEERERSEFRLLQEQAGLVPKQERLDFLYDSGLAVGKGSSDGFKALESFPRTDPTETAASSSTKQQQPSVPGALFEEKPQSANDAWRKLHSDPLLLIRQREQEALARVKNNPIQMAMIRKSVEAKKHKEKASNGKERPEKHHHHQKKSSSSRHQKHESHRRHLDSEYVSIKGEEDVKKGNYRISKYEEHSYKAAAAPPYSEDGSSQRDTREKRKNFVRDLKYKERSPSSNALLSDPPATTEKSGVVKPGMGRRDGDKPQSHHHKSRNNAATRKLSEEERAARLREMQMDAEVHEEQRWKRLRKAEEEDAREITRASPSGRNFLDAAQKSMYGADKDGSSTIEESVRRRTHYSQGRSQVSGEGNAFRR